MNDNPWKGPSTCKRICYLLDLLLYRKALYFIVLPVRQCKKISNKSRVMKNKASRKRETLPINNFSYSGNVIGEIGKTRLLNRKKTMVYIKSGFISRTWDGRWHLQMKDVYLGSLKASKLMHFTILWNFAICMLCDTFWGKHNMGGNRKTRNSLN